MNLLFWGLTVSVFGKVMLAVGVLKAHAEIVEEHRIDDEVINGFKLERWITLAGLLLIVIGYGMEIYFYGFTNLLTCDTSECSASLGALMTN